MNNVSNSIIAIGDVHGCADELDELLSLLPLDKNNTIVFLGDLIDRGPNSKGVVSRIIKLSKEINVVTLTGNHEQMLLEFLQGNDQTQIARFVLNGGSATLASYADSKGKYKIPDEHLEFFKSMPLYFDTPDYFFVHAGVPVRPLSEIDPIRDRDEMLWTRRRFMQSGFNWEKRIVHGHNRVDHVEIGSNRINLDTGCVYEGHLSAIALPSHESLSVPHKAHVPTLLHEESNRRAAIRFLGSVPVTIHRDGMPFLFETVDYSEIGLFFRPVEASFGKYQIFAENDEISGLIGGTDSFSVPFTGRIVRLREVDSIWHYGASVTLDHNRDKSR